MAIMELKWIVLMEHSGQETSACYLLMHSVKMVSLYRPQ